MTGSSEPTSLSLNRMWRTNRRSLKRGAVLAFLAGFALLGTLAYQWIQDKTDRST